MQLLDAAFPLLFLISPRNITPAEIDAMDAAFSAVFARKQRYFLVSVPEGVPQIPSAYERKLLGDWANSPAVFNATKQHCIGTSVVVPNSIARGALTAIFWLWQPPTPIHYVANVGAAINQAIDGLGAERLAPGAGSREAWIADILRAGGGIAF